MSPDTWFMNPHKSALGLGNYDINVIMKALQDKGFEAVWFDKRRSGYLWPSLDADSRRDRNPKTGLDLATIKGFILNIPNPPHSSHKTSQWIYGFVSLPFNLIVSRRHWITILRSPADQLFYNLDSKLEVPQLIGNDDQLMDFLNETNNTCGCEIFVIIPRNTVDEKSWKREESPSSQSLIGSSSR